MGKKEDELMNRCIVYDLYANNQLPRYYIVDRIRYDFESGGWYSVIDLKKTGEMRKYGTLVGAKNYALRLYEKYHKELGDDMDVRIREEYVDTGVFEKEIKQLKKKLALTEDALKQACKECLSFPCSDYCTNRNRCEDCFYKNEFTPEKFKEKAWEIMKSE